MLPNVPNKIKKKYEMISCEKENATFPSLPSSLLIGRDIFVITRINAAVLHI